MKLSAMCLIILLTFIANLVFASHSEHSVQNSNLKFETLVQLPQPEAYQVSTGAEKIKFNFNFLYRPFVFFKPYNNFYNKCHGPQYSLSNYCLLRSKTYYLII